jgi:hypothetical protein
MSKLKCRKCEDVIESKHRHDFVWCKCKSIFVDGGNDYLRCGGDMKNIIFVEEKDGEQIERKLVGELVQRDKMQEQG